MKRVQLTVPVPDKRQVRIGVIVGLLLLVPYLVASMLAPETMPRLGWSFGDECIPANR